MDDFGNPLPDATQIASKAADSLINQGILGTVVVIVLGIAFVVTFVLWKAYIGVVKEKDALQKSWREESVADKKALYDALNILNQTSLRIEKLIEENSKRRRA